jgi:hypothetical protein
MNPLLRLACLSSTSLGHSESLEIYDGIRHYPPTPGVVDVMDEPLAAAPMAILWNVE